VLVVLKKEEESDFNSRIQGVGDSGNVSEFSRKARQSDMFDSFGMRDVGIVVDQRVAGRTADYSNGSGAVVGDCALKAALTA
jgi:hypothetical protein